MYISQLTDYQKGRFRTKRICPICNKRIFDDEPIVYATQKVGRCKLYTFFHKSCIYNVKGGG